MWHKAIWKGHPMRLELTRVGLLVELANHYTTRGAFIVWEVSWRLNRTATYWPPPSSSGHSSVSFILLGCSTGGLGAQTLCWELVSTARSGTLTSSSELQLPDFLSHPGLYHCSTSTQFKLSTRPSPDLFDRMYLLFTLVHFSFNSLAGSRGQYATIRLKDGFFTDCT